MAEPTKWSCGHNLLDHTREQAIACIERGGASAPPPSYDEYLLHYHGGIPPPPYEEWLKQQFQFPPRGPGHERRVGHLPGSLHRRRALDLQGKTPERSEATETTTSPSISSLTLTTALWTGYLRAVSASRGPTLIVDGRDVEALLELRELAIRATAPATPTSR